MKHIINKVEEASIAEEMEIEKGDILLRINDQEIEDVFDYRYLIKNEYLEVLIQKKDGEEWLLEIEKNYDEDLGIEFENSLMSEYRSCCNKCIFCFIDQMPPGMRETLYFKDDDSRLSFLQGNYITLTNMNDKDIERIIQMKMAPINISVQTTNPELRCKMLNNRFAGEKLKYLQRLYDGQVEMNGQIVCCKNVNDGAELERSIRDLGTFLPFMRSVSVVPAGVTRFREGLFLLEPFTKDDAGRLIDVIEEKQEEFFGQYGLHFIHASDELYMTAERDFPEEERYDGYIQLENGVGMMRLFIDEFKEAWINHKKERKSEPARTITIATGKLAYSTICSFAQQMMEAYSGLKIHVYAIRNEYFGESITVSGLITGQDLVSQLLQHQKEEPLGDTLLISSNMLRMGEQVFLDDMTIEEAGKALSIKIVPVDSSGRDFMDAVLYADVCSNRTEEGFVYIKAYENRD